MYYKFTLEKLDFDRNVILKTQVMLTEEIVNDGASIDNLKIVADQIVDKFRNDFNKTFNTKEK